MPGKFLIPEDAIPVTATAPVTTNGGVTADYISLKNVHTVYIVATFTQAVAHQTVIQPKQATAVAGTGVKNITQSVPIWAIDDVSSTSAFTRQTDATSYTLANAATNQKVVFKITPDMLDVENGFDVLGVTFSDSSQATDFVCADYFVDPRYSDPATMLTD